MQSHYLQVSGFTVKAMHVVPTIRESLFSAIRVTNVADLLLNLAFNRLNYYFIYIATNAHG